MGGSANDGGQGPIHGINMTPFVDIALVLLIVFLVTAKLVLQPSQAMPLDLPRAATGEETQHVLAITLTTAGQTRVNGTRVDDDAALAKAAVALQRASPELRVVIQAEGDVTHRRVLHVMDVLAKAEISKVAFAVTREPSPP
jgi:biopolymer transport protein ExbD